MQFLPAIVIHPIAVLLLLLIGWSMRVPGVTRFSRLFAVSLVAASLVGAPVWTWTILVATRLVPWPNIVFAFAVTAVVFAVIVRFYRAPVIIRGSRRNLPLLDDPMITSRVADLSGRLSIRPPCVRLLGSIGGSLDALAWAGCLPTPTIVVTDGLLHRLSDSERDAILAHELGHLATGSLWLYAAVPCLTGVLAILASTIVTTPMCIAIGLCLLIGLTRFVSRPVELACDRWAGEAAGFDKISSSLAKVHAAHPVRADTIIGFLVYATATHPHPEVRLAALRRRAMGPEAAIDPAARRMLVRHRIGGAAAGVVWAATLVWAVVAGDTPAFTPWTYAALASVILAPTVFMLLARARELRRARQRMGRDRRTILLWLGLLLVLVGVVGTPWFNPAVSMPLLLTGLAILLFFALRTARSHRLRIEVEVALRERDPSRALALGRAKPKLVRRDPLLRLNLAVASLLAGDRDTAIRETAVLVRDKPHLKIAQLNLCVFLLDVDPARALQVANEVQPALPKDPSPLILAARALRRLDRLDEAAETTQRAIVLEPHNGVVRAVAAAIKADQGELDAASRLVSEADSLAPGDVFVKVAQAQIALANEPLDRAQAAVEAAAIAVRANPFAVLERDLHTLQERLQTLSGGTAPVLLFSANTQL